MEKIKEARRIDLDKNTKLLGVHKKIEVVYRVEEIMCHQRARCRLKEGDTNMTFFHRYACMRNRLNKTYSLHDGNDILEDEKSIQDHIFKHFKNLFANKNIFRIYMKDGSWTPRVNMIDHEEEFREEEIKQVVWDLTKPRDRMDFHCSFLKTF